MRKESWMVMVVGLLVTSMATSGYAIESFGFTDEGVLPNYSGFITTKDVASGEQFELYLVIEPDAQTEMKLMGFSVDINFDTDYLKLVSVKETFGDVNFDGQVTLEELAGLVTIFADLAVGNIPSLDAVEFNDPNTPEDDKLRIGVLLDPDADGVFSLGELAEIVSIFADGAVDKLPFWTFRIANRPNPDDPSDTWNESVFVADPPWVSNVKADNADNAAVADLDPPHPGLINDLTAVLLARPHRVVEGTRPGFGFNDTAYLARIVFQAKAAGNSEITFGDQRIIIRETFTGVDASGDAGLITVDGQGLTVNVQ